MARKPRVTHRYVLRDGRQIVQFGVTDDLDRRRDEHQADGKKFTTMTPVGPRVTRDSALEWEQSKIEAYDRNHSGRPPRFNKT